QPCVTTAKSRQTAWFCAMCEDRPSGPILASHGAVADTEKDRRHGDRRHGDRRSGLRLSAGRRWHDRRRTRMLVGAGVFLSSLGFATGAKLPVKFEIPRFSTFTSVTPGPGQLI